MSQPSLRFLLVLAAAAFALPAGALADQSSQPSVPAAGHISAGAAHTCLVLTETARCWGFGGNGRLGYGTTTSIGDDETPGSAGAIDVGAAAGVGVEEISAGEGHTCALLEDGTVRCWGFDGNGRLGDGAPQEDVGDNESPADAEPIALGGAATSISAGDSHTCALLDDGSVRCWGYGLAGQLGYGNEDSIGDTETPASAGAVDVGGTVTAISAGGAHTCALLTGGSVRCWGNGASGQLGYNPADPDPEDQNIGDDEVPSSVPVVDLGAGRTATAISAGWQHTCAVLDDKTIRCWGLNIYGQLGLGNISTVGMTQAPGDVAPVDLGPGATAKAVAAGGQHTCAILEDGSVRCWGRNHLGQLGHANTSNIGDDEAASTAGAVMIGAGRTAVAADAGQFHTCALLDDGNVRCWGFASNGRVGYCNQVVIGDNEVPAAAGPVDLGTSGAGCVVAAPPPPPPPPPPAPVTPIAPPPPPAPPPAPAPPAGRTGVDPFEREAERRRELRACLRSASRRSKRARTRARRACMARYARRPGRVRGLRARAAGRTRVVLTFVAPGTDALRAPAARGYLVRQSTRPIRTARDFARAPALCRGSCRFRPEAVGTRITLTITGLTPRTTYYYAVAARDNVSNRLGRRSPAVRVRTR